VPVVIAKGTVFAKQVQRVSKRLDLVIVPMILNAMVALTNKWQVIR